MTSNKIFEHLGMPLLGFGIFGTPWVRSVTFAAAQTNSKGLKLSYEIKQLNLRHTWTIARGSTDFKRNVFVTLERDGVLGYGEAAPNVRYNESPESTVALIKRAIPLFESRDPWNFVDLGHAIQKLEPGQSAAKAALNIALMDWVVKSLGIPMYKYFGLDKNKIPITTFSIGLDAPEAVRQKVREAEDCPILKIKVGRENDEEIIDVVRSVTNKPLRVDANEGWKSKEEALEKIQWLKTQGVEFVEQPLPSSMVEETRWLRERVDIPIIADESVKSTIDIPKLAAAFDGINIKLMKSGGLQEAMRMIWMAKSLGMKIMLGCMIESSVAISAAASLSPLVDYADLDSTLLISNDPFSGVKVKEGRLILNEKPGIGVEPLVFI